MSFFYRSTVRDEIKGIPKEEWMIPLLDKSPFILSEGDRKKLSLSIGLHHNSDLLLDEPTQSLDQNNIFWLLDKIIESEQKSIIIATNNADFIEKLSPYANNILELVI